MMEKLALESKSNPLVKPRTLFGLIGFLSLFTLGCEGEGGSGVIVSERRSIPDATRVSVCCGFEVDFKIGDESELIITGDDNLIEEIEVDYNDKVLEIEWDDDWGNYEPTQPIRLELTLPRLVSFQGSGGMRLFSEDLHAEELSFDLSGGSQARIGQVWVDELTVRESGGSEIEFDLISAKKTRVDSSGGSVFEAQGLSDRLDVAVSRGGVVAGEDLIVDDVRVDLSGGSRLEITALESIVGEASGGSAIELNGDPRKDVDLSGDSHLN